MITKQTVNIISIMTIRKFDIKERNDELDAKIEKNILNKNAIDKPY